MLAYTEKIQETARKLLKDKTVDVFIGYSKGTVPMMNEPVLIRDPDKADMLYWDSFCGLNLCNYLTKREDRIGIVATGCNSRNIVTHIIENQIKREQLYIVGIPCTGMIDHRAVARAVGHREIVEVKEDGDKFTVTGRDFEETLERATARIVRTRIPPQPTSEICPQCGKAMVIRSGRYGKFLGCSGYPKCKSTRPLSAEIEQAGGGTCDDTNTRL